MSKLIPNVVGGLLCLVSMVMVAHCAKAGIAHGLYLHARYGLAGDDAREVVAQHASGESAVSGEEVRDLARRVARRCRTAHRHHSYDYRFCALAADLAFQAAGTLGQRNSECENLLTESRRWCETGLRLNFFDRGLRLRKTGLLRESGKKKEAADYWAEYTDWHFWHPENHYMLAKLYVGCGEFQKAVEARKWWEILTTRAR